MNLFQFLEQYFFTHFFDMDKPRAEKEGEHGESEIQEVIRFHGKILHGNGNFRKPVHIEKVGEEILFKELEKIHYFASLSEFKNEKDNAADNDDGNEKHEDIEKVDTKNLNVECVI